MSKKTVYYVQFGVAPNPCRTMRVADKDVRHKPVPPEKNPARPGPFASHYELRVNGRWRRLFFNIAPTNPRHFIRVDRVITPVTVAEE